MKHGYWLDHGTILEWLESDGESVFVEWIGIRKILSDLKFYPWAFASCLGHIVCGIMLKCIKAAKEG